MAGAVLRASRLTVDLRSSVDGLDRRSIREVRVSDTRSSVCQVAHR